MGFRNQIVAATALIRSAIQSPNYDPGVAGWSVNKDGSAEFGDLTVTSGSVTTTPSGDGSTITIEDGQIIFRDDAGATVASISVTDLFGAWPTMMNFPDGLFIGSTGDEINLAGWRVSPMSITREPITTAGAAPLGSSAVMGTSTLVPFPDVGNWIAHLYAYPMIDVDATGRAGWIWWERDNGSGWSQIGSRVRWHDLTEQQNIYGACIATDFTDAGVDSEIQYRCIVSNDGGLSNVTLRGDSVAYIEWWYR